MTWRTTVGMWKILIGRYNLLVISWNCHWELESSAIWGYFFGLLALSMPLHFLALASETVALNKSQQNLNSEGGSSRFCAV